MYILVKHARVRVIWFGIRLTKRYVRQFRDHQSTNSALDYSQSIREKRRRWQQWGSRWD